MRGKWNTYSNGITKAQDVSYTAFGGWTTENTLLWLGWWSRIQLLFSPDGEEDRIYFDGAKRFISADRYFYVGGTFDSYHLNLMVTAPIINTVSLSLWAQDHRTGNLNRIRERVYPMNDYIKFEDAYLQNWIDYLDLYGMDSNNEEFLREYEAAW